MPAVTTSATPRSYRTLLVLLGIWTLAFLLRAIYLADLSRTPGFPLLLGDARSYDAWAQVLSHGDWFGHDVFYQAPLYPYLLGILYALVGHHPAAALWLQAGLGATACVFLAGAGRTFFSQGTGLLAGGLLAVYPTAIFFDGSLQKSSLDLFLLTLLLWRLGKLQVRPTGRQWAVVGVVLGLLGLTRENALALVPVVAGWLWLSFGGRPVVQRLRWLAGLLAGLALVVLPVGLRNQAVGGEFHLTTAQFGPNFYIGNGAQATGMYQPLQWGRGSPEFEQADAIALAKKASGRSLTPSEVSRFWTARALAEIGADPRRWAALMMRKWLLVWNTIELGDTEDLYTADEWSSLLRGLTSLLHFGVIAPLAALGLCVTWKRRRALWLLYLMLLTYALSVTVFYVFARYRLPLVPFLLLFAAAGTLGGVGWVRAGRFPVLLVAAAIAALVGVLANRVILPPSLIRAETHNNRGAALERRGDFPEAIDAYTTALRLRPAFPEAHYNLGIVLSRQGQQEEAARHFAQAIQLKPDFVQAWTNLGYALAAQGRRNEAIPIYLKALRLKPDHALAHQNLGVALLQEGRPEEAMQHFAAVLQLDPDNAEARIGLQQVQMRVMGKPVPGSEGTR